MLTKNMLGDNEALRKFFSGPLYTLWVGYLYSNAEVVNLGVVNGVNEFSRLWNGPVFDFISKCNNGDPELLLQFQKCLRGEPAWAIPASCFRIWRTVQLHTHKSIPDLYNFILRRNLQTAEGVVQHWIDAMVISRFVDCNESEEDLVVLSNKELGFKKSMIETAQTYKRSKDLGLEPCSHETILQILDYLNQVELIQKWPKMYFVTEPIVNLNDNRPMIGKISYKDSLPRLGFRDFSSLHCLDTYWVLKLPKR